jgi:hypothetical protein
MPTRSCFVRNKTLPTPPANHGIHCTFIKRSIEVVLGTHQERDRTGLRQKSNIGCLWKDVKVEWRTYKPAKPNEGCAADFGGKTHAIPIGCHTLVRAQSELNDEKLFCAFDSLGKTILQSVCDARTA